MALPNLVRFDDGRLLTRNLAPGQRVYDEELHTVAGEEHRTWNPMKSKLGSYLVKGGRYLDLREDATVLYLGAANGTTPSHVSDIVARGTLVAVEFSPRSFRDLIRVSTQRPNMVPVLADAWRPELYDRFVGKVDLLFQDIAQRQQGAIFAKNILRFKPKLAIIAVKARSVDVAANPRDVYQAVAAEVAELTGYDVMETVDLGPFERDHAAIVLVPGSGKPKAQGQQREPVRAERREERRDDRPQRDDTRSRRSGEGDAASQRGGGPRGGGYQRDERPRGGGGGGYGGGGGGYRDDRPRGGGGGWQQRGPPRGGGGGGWQDRPPRDDRPRGGGGGWQERPPRDDRPPRDQGGENRRKWK